LTWYSIIKARADQSVHWPSYELVDQDSLLGRGNEAIFFSLPPHSEWLWGPPSLL